MMPARVMGTPIGTKDVAEFSTWEGFRFFFSFMFSSEFKIVVMPNGKFVVTLVHAQQ